jgi:very-short-patch-repair endonuclease
MARRLRKTMTTQEVKLWVHLRAWRSRGFRMGYIVDFVYMKHRVVVEVDGGQHNLDPHQTRDACRDENLGRSGFRVLRF